MRARFVGGPLNGTERALTKQQRALGYFAAQQTEPLTPYYLREGTDEPTPSTLSFKTVRYLPVRQVETHVLDLRTGQHKTDFYLECEVA